MGTEVTSLGARSERRQQPRPPREDHRYMIERDQRPISPPVAHERRREIAAGSGRDVDDFDALALIFVDSQIDSIFLHKRVPDAAVAARPCIERDEIAKQLIAAVGENASLPVENPFEIAAKLIGVVDVAGKMEPRYRANRKSLGVDARSVIAVRKYPNDRSNRRDRACDGSSARDRRNRNDQQRQRGEVETLIAHVLNRETGEENVDRKSPQMTSFFWRHQKRSDDRC